MNFGGNPGGFGGMPGGFGGMPGGMPGGFGGNQNVFDSNHDGRLDAFEQSDMREFRFADANGDGALNRNEFARVENPAKFQMYDTNHDGFVDSAEYAAGEYRTEHRFGF